VLNFASVNWGSIEPKRTVPGSLGPANLTVLAQYGMVNLGVSLVVAQEHR